MHKVFISYHHGNDQYYKEKLLELNHSLGMFWDRSVGDGDIDDRLPPDTIRRKIRDKWLRDSTVTVLLVGTETRYRKHVDWELKSSMINGPINKRSGILVITLPNTHSSQMTFNNSLVPSTIFANISTNRLTTRPDLERAYPELPPRIIDNFLKHDVTIRVVPWNEIAYFPDRLRDLISEAYNNRFSNNYDLSRTMRMKDEVPRLGSLGYGYL